MFKAYLKSLLVLVSFFTIFSCSSVPTHINIAPELNLKTGTYTFTDSPTWAIDSKDLRIARHLIEIVDGDNVAKIINEQQSLRLLVENNLTQAWVSNKLKVAADSEHNIEVQLIKSLATVTEGTASYEVKSQMIIKIQLAHQGKRFEKQFRSNNQWEAAFSTSISRITEELNTQLSQLLNQVIQDQELNDKLQQF